MANAVSIRPLPTIKAIRNGTRMTFKDGAPNERCSYREIELSDGTSLKHVIEHGTVEAVRLDLLVTVFDMWQDDLEGKLFAPMVHGCSVTEAGRAWQTL